MQTNGKAISNQKVPLSASVWEAAKGWTREHTTQEGLVDVALALTVLDAVVFVLISLHRAFGSYTLTGF